MATNGNGNPGETPVDGPSLAKRGPDKHPRGMFAKQMLANKRETILFAQKCFANPKTRFRIWEGLQDGTLPPLIEARWMEVARMMPKGTKDTDMNDTVTGLFTLLLRRRLNEDPLADAKPAGAASTIIEQQPERPALEPRPSIVPPSRPRRQSQGKGELKPGETELS